MFIHLLDSCLADQFSSSIENDNRGEHSDLENPGDFPDGSEVEFRDFPKVVSKIWLFLIHSEGDDLELTRIFLLYFWHQFLQRGARAYAAGAPGSRKIETEIFER